MELVIKGKQLELSADFAIEIEETNPFFNEKGSQSLPVKLPFSQYNLSILDNPNRIARTNKLDTEHNAVLRHGVFQRNGRLVVFSASKAEGISCTFYMDEGEFYTKIKDAKMTDIEFTNETDPFTGDYAQKATQWMQHFENVQKGTVEADYVIFPVATKVTGGQNEITWQDFSYEMLNEPDTNSNTVPKPLLGYEERVIDGVNVPVGYGVTPFLKLNYLLRAMFLHFGYYLEESLFDTDEDLSKLAVLNNNADTVCAGKLNYKQLVPTCTVTEFIECIQNKFCCIFSPNSGKKTMTARFFQTAENLNPDMDISPFVVENPVISFEPFRQIKLSAGTSLETAEPATETLEQLINDNLYVAEVAEFEIPNELVLGEILIRKATGKVYTATSANKSALKNIGSVYFNYDKRTPNLEYDERKSEDEQLPVFKKLSNAGTGLPIVNSYFPFIGDKRNLNTGIKEGTIISEEKAGECKIMFCFDRGIQGTVYLGTPFCYDVNGTKIGNLSLQYAGANGLFVRFWKTYDALLRHAFRKVTVKLNMPVSELLKFKVHTPKLLAGTPVLPTNLKYSISAKGIRITEAEFLTLRLLKPYNLEEEQEVPPFNPNDTPYYWVRFNNIVEVLQNAKNQYTLFNNITLQLIEFPPAPGYYTSPTEAQYNAGGQYHTAQYQCQIKGRFMWGGDITVIATTTYTAWLEPRSR